MKLEAKMRLLAATDEELLSAAGWLGSFFEQSWSINPRYLKLAFVQKLLKPLVEKVPYVPANSSALYRIVGMKKELAVGSLYELPPDRLYSCTEMAGATNWKSLADAIGADYEPHVYVLQVISKAHEMFNHRWVFGPVIKYYKKYLAQDRRTEHLLEMKDEFAWQKEVVVFSSSPIKTRVVTKLKII